MKIIKNFFALFILALLLATCSESTTSSPSVDPNIPALKALIYTNAKGNLINSINSKPGVATNLYPKLLNLPEGVSATNYALKDSSSLPSSLKIDSTTGIISGTFANADEINNHKSTIIAVLDDSSATSLEYTLTFNLAALKTLPALKALVYTNAKGNFITSINSKPGVATNLYPRLLNLPEGVKATSYALKAGSSLPSSLKIDSKNGLISGTFANASEINNHKSIIIAILNDDSATKLEYIITFTLAAPTLPTLYYTNKKGTQIASVTAIWGEATNLSPALINLPGETTATGYALKAGSLPEGLSLHPTKGIISGNLNHASSLDNHESTIEVTLSDSSKLEVELIFTVPLAELSYKDADDSPVNTVTDFVGETITLTPSLDKAFSTVTADNYGVKSGSLPDELSINDDGVISGTLNDEVDNVAVIIEATLNGGAKIEKVITFNINVRSLPPAELSYKDADDSPVSTVTAFVGETITLTPSLDKAFRTASYRVKSGSVALPGGLSIANNGVISGTLNAAVDNAAVTIEATLNDVTKIEKIITFNIISRSLDYTNINKNEISTVVAKAGVITNLSPKKFIPTGVTAGYAFKGNTTASTNGLKINTTTGLISGVFDKSFTNNIVVELTLTINRVETVLEKAIPFEIEPAETPFSARNGHQVVAYKDEMYLIGGYDGDRKDDVWKSTNGANWVVVTNDAAFSTRDDHKVVAYKDEMYLIGGYDGVSKNDVWKSSDGEKWLEVTNDAAFSARFSHQVVVYKDEMYLIGGYSPYLKGNVWKSSDGENWTKLVEYGPFVSSTGHRVIDKHQVVVLNTTMYLIAGSRGFFSPPVNDVYSSTDGANWSSVMTTGDVFSARGDHLVVVLNRTMYLIGGGTTGLNDVYKSSDGAVWEKLINDGNAPFSKRYNHQMVVLGGEMYLIGGYDGTNRLKDVWKSSNGKDWFLIAK